MQDQEDDVVVGEIMDAILGLAWLEEEEGKSLGWGDMNRIHRVFSGGLKDVDKMVEKELGGEGRWSQ